MSRTIKRNKPASRKVRSATKRRQRSPAPRTGREYFAKPEKLQDIMDKVVQAVSKMRAEHLSLQKASQQCGVSPKTVKTWAPSALKKQANGKWTAKKRDSLLRVLKLPTSDGMQDIAVKGSATASTIADYLNCLHHYLRTGDDSRLKAFRGKAVKDADGKELPLLTDRKQLNRLGFAGALSFESLYAKAA